MLCTLVFLKIDNPNKPASHTHHGIALNQWSFVTDSAALLACLPAHDLISWQGGERKSEWDQLVVRFMALSIIISSLLLVFSSLLRCCSCGYDAAAPQLFIPTNNNNCKYTWYYTLNTDWLEWKEVQLVRRVQVSEMKNSLRESLDVKHPLSGNNSTQKILFCFVYYLLQFFITLILPRIHYDLLRLHDHLRHCFLLISLNVFRLRSKLSVIFFEKRTNRNKF